ncbi:hypothetical protein [Ruminococcus sp.]
MTCPHCAASISEKEERCPYCDSYIEHKIPKVSPPVQNRTLLQNQGEDKTEPLLILLSFIIPMAGIILGAIQLSTGKAKSGKIYLVLGIISFFVLPCSFSVLPIMFSLLFNMKA